jgi:hypothetical protein
MSHMNASLTDSGVPAFSMAIFIFACIGALAPEIVRLYSLRNSDHVTFSLFYIFASILFILLGGIVGWILPATTYWGAFYTGASTPVLISSILNKAAKHGPVKQRQITRSRLPISSPGSRIYDYFNAL